MASNSFAICSASPPGGESHGPAIGCVVDGCPALIDLSEADIQPYLDKRRPAQSRYTTQRKESDTVEILSGVFEGKTTELADLPHHPQRGREIEGLRGHQEQVPPRP